MKSMSQEQLSIIITLSLIHYISFCYHTIMARWHSNLHNIIPIKQELLIVLMMVGTKKKLYSNKEERN